jgi:hypothetical protein
VAHDIIDGSVQYVFEAILTLARGARVEVVDDHPFNEVIDGERAAAFKIQLIEAMEDGRQEASRLGKGRKLFRPLDH